jgi:hypothetical protein
LNIVVPIADPLRADADIRQDAVLDERADRVAKHALFSSDRSGATPRRCVAHLEVRLE